MRRGVIRKTDFLGRKEFYAVCGVASHGSCIKTKTAKDGPKRGQGRPLGFLSAWLRCGPACANKAEHMPKKVSLEQRQAGRDMVMVSKNARTFLELEREQKLGEPEEPLEFV